MCGNLAWRMCGNVWKYVAKRGAMWIDMETCENMWKYAEMCGNCAANVRKMCGKCVHQENMRVEVAM